MQAENKTVRFFSGPLMKQDIKSNWILAVVVTIVLCMMTTVVSFAMSIMGSGSVGEEEQEAQADFYSHLYAIASYNQMAGTELSYEDFADIGDTAVYDKVFEMLSAESEDTDFSSEKFKEAIEKLEKSEVPMDTYVRQFEYVFALSGQNGVFSGEELSVDDMMAAMLSTMGVADDLFTNMAEMDTTAMLHKMYFTVMGLLPLFLFIVVAANSLIVNQVDSGSLAYILSTPTKRSAVVNTQAVFLIIVPFLICSVVCAVRTVDSKLFTGGADVEVNMMLYLGMYILTEAVAGICYMGSCLFNQSRRSLAFGGGIAVWFFLASLLGMFGSEDMVNTGMGVEELGIFNKLTLVGLYDTQAITTIGTDTADMSFVWKLAVLAGIAAITYTAGNIRFQKKDLPL